MLCAGVARSEITPPIGVELTGYAARQQPSTGILEPLYARALYLEHGSERGCPECVPIGSALADTICAAFGGEPLMLLACERNGLFAGSRVASICRFRVPNR